MSHNTKMLPQEIAIAIRELVERMINDMTTKVVLGVWISTETEDTNLSKVQTTDDMTYRYVPKLSGLTLANGDRVLMLKSKGTPLTILGKVVGNINILETL